MTQPGNTMPTQSHAHNKPRLANRTFSYDVTCLKSAIYVCGRLGNPESNAKSENGFHLREIRPQGGFQLRNPNPDFMDFLFTVRLGNPKKDLQNYSREQRSSFC